MHGKCAGKKELHKTSARARRGVERGTIKNLENYVYINQGH